MSISKSDQINLDLDALGIEYNPADHWKTREKLLTDAKEQLGIVPVQSDTVEVEGEIEVTTQAKPEVITGTVITTNPPKFIPDGEPAMNPLEGDKTPAVVAWRLANWSAEKFAKHYDKRTIPN